jgi:hypothetical protein
VGLPPGSGRRHGRGQQSLVQPRHRRIPHLVVIFISVVGEDGLDTF